MVLYDVAVVVFSWRFVAVSMVLLVRTKCWLEIVVVWDVYRTCRGKRWVVYFDGYKCGSYCGSVSELSKWILTVCCVWLLEKEMVVFWFEDESFS